MAGAARENFKKLYERHWRALMDGLGPLAKERSLSSPWLVDPDAHDYSRAPVRWLAVGKEAREWKGTLGTLEVDDLLKAYKDFRLGCEYKSKPLVQALHELHCLLNPEGPRDGFLWTNLARVDEKGKSPRDDIFDKLISAFNVLPDEIRLTEPQVVVFFTGPNYDERIRKTFHGCEFLSVPGYTHRELAVLQHQDLPKLTYRTYHPNYLRQGKKWYLIKEVASLAQRGLA